MELSIFDAIAKHGIGLITVGSGILLLWKLTKFIIERMGDAIDKLIEHMSEFTGHVRREHKEHSVEHNNLMRQHEKIMDGLGRINGYKD